MPLPFIFQENCHDHVTSRMEQLGYSQREQALITVLVLPEEYFWMEDTDILLFLLAVPGEPWFSQPWAGAIHHWWAADSPSVLWDGCGLCKGKGTFTRKMRWKSSAESGQGVFQLWFTLNSSWLNHFPSLFSEGSITKQVGSWNNNSK